MGKEHELNKVAIVMGQVLHALKELEPQLKTSYDVYNEKESLVVLAYMCRVGILDRILNTTYLQNPELPIVIPLDIIRVRRETISTGLEITVGKIQELASKDPEVEEMVDSVLEKGEMYYALENNLPESVKATVR